MAKQRGIIRFSGKIEGRSYYNSRLGGALSRSIDPNLSERVKTAPEYALLRATAKEFGQCGKLAGVFKRNMGDNWRYIYPAMAVGKMTRYFVSLIQQDGAHAVGGRVIENSRYLEVREFINRLSKNLPPRSVVDAANLMRVNVRAADIMIPEVKIGFQLADTLNALGANSFRVSIYALGVYMMRNVGGEYDPEVPKAMLPLLLWKEEHSNVHWEENDTLLNGIAVTIPEGLRVQPPFTEDIDGRMGGVLIVFEPLKKVGQRKDVLQRSCSAYWAPLSQLDI